MSVAMTTIRDRSDSKKDDVHVVDWIGVRQASAKQVEGRNTSELTDADVSRIASAVGEEIVRMVRC